MAGSISREVLGTLPPPSPGTPPSRWLGVSPSADSRLTLGAELARKFGEGVLRRAPAQHVQAVRKAVTEACGEIIQVGARVRPLSIDGAPAGWVRGFHDTERRTLARWLPDHREFVFRCLLLSTTLGEEAISSLSSLEVTRLVKLVMAMGDRDASLYPYLSAFSTTRESEFLWHSGGDYASFRGLSIPLPDGKSMTVLCPSDHARLWASLCTYREQAKERLDDTWNAALIMRSWAGRSVDGLVAELRTATKQLRVDAPEPWENIVATPPDRVLDDGWAHLENMETREGMLKELYGMLGNDRHERLMQEFERQQLDAAERRKREIEGIVARRGGPGISGEVITVQTEEEASRKERDMRRGRPKPASVSRERTETVLDIREKLGKYRG